MIRELYNNIVCKNFSGGRFGREVQKEIMLLLEEMKENMDGFQCGKYKDNLYLIAAADKIGSVKGVLNAFQLFGKCIQE